ncbi:MAG TPA: PSD1 and planctomycete cytochrome C domain-containing protein [Blastocatellia bacterium]|nr:PSD1 and planctomycete cytochrome C domain-containing protein [Blastocatellia bacterium]
MSKRTVIKSFITLAVGGIFMAASLRQAQTAPPIQEPSREGLEFFEKRIRPALAENCYACHSEKSKKPQGGLLLDSIEAMLKGGASGQPAIVPGDPEKSLLIKAIRQTDAKLQMPMGGKLPDQVIKDFEAWVKMGAPAPRSSAAAAASNYPAYDFDEARKFWSFQPVKDHRPPKVKNEAWVKSPIDRFILAKLEEKGLKPVADADKRALIRRATFDLTGLPPTPEEVEAFLKDTSPSAFEKVVDRLLSSQAYGEKWGRHWLDVVRYADTAGDNSDYPVIAAYRYRNYVIESFNKDKPYDQFIREQIAGDIFSRPGSRSGSGPGSGLGANHSDPRAEGEASEAAKGAVEIPGAKNTSAAEIEKSRQEKIVATGYLAISRRFGSRNKEMNLTIDDTIDNLGKTFLGLSVSCARCHDHKFDPIPQRDYYALYGVFNSIRYSFPGAEIYPHPAEMVALVGGKEAENFYQRQRELSEIDDAIERLKGERGAAARNKKMKDEAAAKAEAPAATSKEAKPSEAKRDNQTGGAEEKSEPQKQNDSLPADYDRDLVDNQKAQASKRMPDEVEAEWTRVRQRQSELHAHYINTPKAYAVVEGLPANARIHRRGDPKSLGDEVPRGFLTILSPGGARQIPKDHRGSGREFLAGWIADAKNPLTARVMVNRIWAYHFGKGIVQTPNDFGARGHAPTHPELLDWLASRFIEGGWSIKKMHRMIMLSHAYRLASDAVETGRLAREAVRRNSALDVNDDFLWRFNRRRLEAEEIRDSILAVSGSLDRTMGGEHPFPPEPTWRFSQHEQFFAVYETNRRSVYLMQQRLKKHPFFEIFDGADTNATTDSRAQSVTPVQALFLMNSPFMHDQSNHFAVRIGMAYDTLRERIDYAFRLAYGRAPRLEEIREAQQFLRRTRLELQAANTPVDQLNQKALASYLRVVMSSNEFLYLD